MLIISYLKTILLTKLNFFQMKKSLFLLLTAIACIFVACEEDFDVNADREDITVVYGLLSKSDSIQYLKINKAFLYEGNALEMAQNEDASAYHDEITVSMIETGSPNDTIFFDTITKNKEDGLFYKKQIVYRTITDIHVWGTYKVIIYNKEQNKYVTAQTVIVNDFYITTPKVFFPGYIPPLTFSTNGEQEFEWKSSKFGKKHQANLQFIYEETEGTNLPETFTVDWVFQTKTATDLDGGQEMSVGYKGATFYKNLQANIEEKPNTKRRVLKLLLNIDVAAEEMSVYMDINKPSNTIVQERPEYTNINNGIGIFSSRFNKVLECGLSTPSYDSLFYGQYTDHLGFEY